MSDRPTARLAEWKEIHSRSSAAGYDPQTLFKSTIAVVGVGALGQNVSLDLALAGVGRLIVIDFDEFEPHNATRSPLYPSQALIDQIGLQKSATVAAGLRELCTAPNASVRHLEGAVQAVPHSLLASADVLLSAVDSQSARSYLSEFGRLYGIPVVEGGFAGPLISMTVDCGSPDDPCYRCTNPTEEGSFSCTQYALQAEASGVIPAIQSAAAVLGGLICEAAVGLLHNVRSDGFRKAHGNIRDAYLRELIVSRDPYCPGLHISTDSVLSVGLESSGTMADLIRNVPRSYTKIRLLQPFVVEMSCRGQDGAACGAPLRPLVNQHVWQESPYCSDCAEDSTYNPATNDPFFPLEYKIFSREEIEQLGLGVVPLSAFNLGPGSRVVFYSDASNFLIVEIALPADEVGRRGLI